MPQRIYLTKEGINAGTATVSNDFLLQSEYPVLKIYYTGYFGITI